MASKGVAILTSSDRCSRGEAKDTSGDGLAKFFENSPRFAVRRRSCVPDDVEEIRKVLEEWSDEGSDVNLILTTGGTGFSSRDVTPEATKEVIRKEAPAIVHMMTAKSLEVTPMAMLSRAVAGIRNRTLIVNLPGSGKASKECLEFIAPALDHATDLLMENGDEVEKTHALVQGGHVCPHGDVKSEPFNVANRCRKSPHPMISVHEAQETVLKHCGVLSTEEVWFSDCLGRVLAEDVFAIDPLPPFAASIKDGYAVIAADSLENRLVVGASVAGLEPGQASRLLPGQCSRINTGAPLPPGADAVVQVEDTELVKASEDGKEEKEIKILSNPRSGLDVRQIGSDIEKGARVLPKRSRLGAAELGVLATVGITKVRVFRRPIVGLLSTGNELQDPEVCAELKQADGKIRDSNKTVLKSLIHGENGFPVVDLGIAVDDPEVLLAVVKSGLSKCDLLVTTGGVSMGDRDFLRRVVVDELRATLHFARVRMKPGKPTTFATIDEWIDGSKKLIIGLPGNPVSATVTSHLYVLPACRKMTGHLQPMPSKVRAKLPCEVQLDPRPEYQRVVLRFKPGEAEAEAWITGNQISSRLPSLTAANGLLLLPPRTEGKPEMRAGEVVDCLVIGPLLSEAF